nr:hypothetical protein [Saprospiraceae bacterium]
MLTLMQTQITEMKPGSNFKSPIPRQISLWVGWAVFFFLMVSILGLSLRYYFIGEIPGFSFNNIKHGHSHAAMLGWAFLIAGAILMAFFVQKTKYLRWYQSALFLNVVAVLGMTFSFPFEGYGFYSISFSTLHVIAAYIFAYAFLRDLNAREQKGIADRFAKWSVLWMLASTVGLWSIAPISAMLGALHPLYYMSIQWFLHFQFIGWFTYATIAGLLKFMESHGRELEIPNHTFLIIQVSTILTYALSISWSTPSSILFYLNSLGVTLQVLGFYMLLKPIILSLRGKRVTGNSWMLSLLQFGLLMLMARILIQFAVVIPAVAEISYTLRMYVIAFIHLIMIGTFTFMAAGLLGLSRYLSVRKVAVWGWKLVLVGFILTEILMFGQGTMLWAKMGFIPSFHHYMFWASVLFPIGLLGIAIGQLNHHRQNFQLKSIFLT